MAPFPLPLTDLLGHWGAYAVYLVIGIAFGAVLEMAGFGYSPKLAAQFYFKDFTVLKVMFGAIVVAMIGIFLTSGLGLLDYNLIWVNPTYLWPGIIGGLIMGFGFIIGGFCPGTSLVAAATLKLDGILFVLGVFFGIFMFGETVGGYEEFWYSSYMGRFTLPQLFGIDTGVLVLLIAAGAIAVFAIGEQAERIFGGKDPAEAPRWRYGAAGGVLALAAVVFFVGQPTAADRWARIEDEQQAMLDNREVQIHPGELLATIHDNKLVAYMIDVRDEGDYNLFHILDSVHIPLDELRASVPEFNVQPSNTVFIVMSNDEAAAIEAYKLLTAQSVPNVYILEGGINNWINTFGGEEFKSSLVGQNNTVDDELQYAFMMALGARHPAADPNPDVFALEYDKKIKLDAKRGPTSGGCG